MQVIGFGHLHTSQMRFLLGIVLNQVGDHVLGVVFHCQLFLAMADVQVGVSERRLPVLFEKVRVGLCVESHTAGRGVSVADLARHLVVLVALNTERHLEGFVPVLAGRVDALGNFVNHYKLLIIKAKMSIT